MATATQLRKARQPRKAAEVHAWNTYLAATVDAPAAWYTEREERAWHILATTLAAQGIHLESGDRR